VAGAGYSPFAPGTAGSAVGLVIVAGLSLFRLPPIRATLALALGAALLFAVGVWAAGEAEVYFARTDPSQVVIDEVVGQILTFLLLPHASYAWLAAGFLLFRIFDILKPFPARQAERIPRGWGIMVDDVVAGLYAMAALTLAKWFFR
jgi:phosphatidylglycerophosphatase A